jgi:threonine synthase
LGVIRVGDEVDVCIPTGNFGNLLGAVYARRLGLPLRRLISASNTNNVIADFVRSGTYDLRGRRFTATVSPSIDILVSSNLERFLHLLTDGDTDTVKRLFTSLHSNGHFTVSPQLLQRVQSEVASGWCEEQQCLSTIRRVYEETGQLIDPHTAVAVHVANTTTSTSSSRVPLLISSTAHYGKFPSTMLHALTGEPYSSLPSDIGALFDRLASLKGVAPVSRQHPQLTELIHKPLLHTHTVPANKDAVIREMERFFHAIAQRERTQSGTVRTG